MGRGVSWLPENPPFGLKSGWGTLNAERSCERYWVQERIKYTTMDTRAGDTNRAPGFTSIRSSLTEPGLAREGVARQPQLQRHHLQVCMRSKLLIDLCMNNYRTKETHSIARRLCVNFVNTRAQGQI